MESLFSDEIGKDTIKTCPDKAARWNSHNGDLLDELTSDQDRQMRDAEIECDHGCPGRKLETSEAGWWIFKQVENDYICQSPNIVGQAVIEQEVHISPSTVEAV